MSGGLGAGNLSASGVRCDVGRAGAASVGTGWSVAAETEVWERAAGTGPGLPVRWVAPGPASADVGTGPSVVAAEGSWGCCAGLVTPQGPNAVAGAASGGGPAKSEKMEVGGHFDLAEGPEGAAEDLQLALLHQPWRSVAASVIGAGSGAGASAEVQL